MFARFALRRGLPRVRRSRSRGATLVETVTGLAILAFAIAASAAMFVATAKQQALGRAYSMAQSDIRSGLRLLTRAVRHGYNVADSSTNFGTSMTSSASQLIVLVPMPTTGSPPTSGSTQLRFYLSGTTLYKQSQSDYAASSPGTPLIYNVAAVTFNYSKTTDGVPENADPGNANGLTVGQATEVRVTVTVKRERRYVRSSALVMLRNAGLTP